MGAVLLSLAAAGTGFSALPGQGVAANLPSAKARAAALVADEVRQGERVHALTVAYLHDAGVVVRLRSEVHALDRSVRSASAEYASTRALLQQQALLSYAGGVPSGAPAGPGQADFITQADQAAYEHLAIGDLTEVLARFDAAAARLASRLAAYRAHLAESTAAERSAAATRSQALARAESLQQLVDNARARVATLRAAALRTPTGPPQAKGLVQVVQAQLAGKAPVFGGQSPARRSQPAAGPPTPTTSSPTTLALVPLAAPTTVTTAATTTTTTTVPTTTTAPPTTTTTTAASSSTVPAASTTTAPPAPVSATPPAPSTTAAGSHPPPAGGAWLELRTCESGDNYQENTGNGFYGAYQFSGATWSGLGYSGLASEAPYWDQDAAAQHLQSQDGWAPWPACAATLGL